MQESDGSYFECFTALSWKRENRRMSAVRIAEARAETVPESEKESNIFDGLDKPEQKEQLYLDVLYAISNSVGAPAPGVRNVTFKRCKTVVNHGLSKVFLCEYGL